MSWAGDWLWRADLWSCATPDIQAVGGEIPGHWLIAIVVQPEKALECLHLSPGNTPLYKPLERLFWQQEGSG